MANGRVMLPDSLSKSAMSHNTRDVFYDNRVISTLCEGFSESDIARFWAKVAVGGPDECWLWTAGTFGSKPYGQFGIQEAPGKQKHLYAHRVAFRLAHGPIAEGAYICHSCDTPLCCNPAHLFAGTHTDNMRDASRKGRLSVPRTRNRLAKPEVIRRWLAGEGTQRELAAEYHVCLPSVNRWLKGLHPAYSRPAQAERLKRTA